MELSEEKRKVLHLADTILTIARDYDADIAIAALQAAVAGTIIHSTETHLEALEQFSEVTGYIARLIDEYPALQSCHWEHEN